MNIHSTVHNLRRSCLVAAFAALATQVSADDGLHTESQGWRSTSANSCSAVHGTNKSDLKEDARAHCRDDHGSSGLNILRNENYTKTSCEKTKDGNQVVEVIARGTLTFMCKI